jgi:hypothetical protein
MRRASRRARRGAIAVTVTAAALGLAGIAWAAFSNTTSNPAGTFTAKRIFPGLRTTSAWQISDQADTSASVENDDFLAVDAVEYRTLQNVTTGSNQYVDVDFYATRPAGLSVSGAQATIAIASQGGAGSGNACYWFEVRLASTNALLSTHGSYAAAVSCSTGQTQAAISTSIASGVTSTDIVNDLRLRIYPWETSGGKKADIDQAIVSGSTPYTSFEAYEKQVTDVTGASTTTQWGLAASGGTFYESSGNWATTYAANRYIAYTVKPFVPTGSVITSASFKHSYRSRDAGATTCWYFEAYQGTTLIASYGSSGSPISCNSSNTTWVTNTTSMPAVDTVAEANGLIIRIYMTNTATRKSQHDLFEVSFDYYLDQ